MVSHPCRGNYAKMENAMTDEEIQCAILKIGCNNPRGIVHLPRIATDHGVDYKRVLFNEHILRDEGLVRTRKMGGSTPGPIAGDVEITEKGRREYKSRCEQQ